MFSNSGWESFYWDLYKSLITECCDKELQKIYNGTRPLTRREEYDLGHDILSCSEDIDEDEFSKYFWDYVIVYVPRLSAFRCYVKSVIEEFVYQAASNYSNKNIREYYDLYR